MGTRSAPVEAILVQIPAGKRNIPPVFQPIYSPKPLSDETWAFILMTSKTPLSPRIIIPAMLADCWLYSETLGGLTKPSCNSKAVCLQLNVLRFPCHTEPSQFMSSCYIILDTSQLCFSENKWKEMFSSFFVQNNVLFCFKFSLQNDCQCFWYVQVRTLSLTFPEIHQ